MINKLLKFINILRNMNIRISISETIDVINALKEIEIEDKMDFKNALRTCLIKDKEDIDSFNKLFDIYFIFIEEQEKIEFNEGDFESIFEQISSEFDNGFDDIGKEEQVNTFNEQMDNSNSADTSISDTFQDKIDMFQVGSEDELKNEAKNISNNMSYNKQTIDKDVSTELIKQGYDMVKNQSISKANKEFIEEKYEKLKEFVKQEIEKNEVKKHGEEAIQEIMKNEYQDIYDKDFLELSKDDIQLIKKALNKLTKKLNNLYIRKKINSKKGNINIKKTIQKSIKYGITKDIFYKKRKKDKNKLIVLCDISGSMINYVKFILQIVIGIQEVFDDVKIFVFMEKLQEITNEMENSDDVINTIENIYANNNLGYGTDYGNVLFWFNKKDIFDKKTRVIIIGDGENNGEEIGDDYLFNIKEKVLNIYWLNPVKENDWCDIFNLYNNIVNESYQCSNLRELENVMNIII